MGCYERAKGYCYPPNWEARQQRGFTDNGVRLGREVTAWPTTAEPASSPSDGCIPPAWCNSCVVRPSPPTAPVAREVIRESLCGKYSSILRPFAGQVGSRSDLQRWALEATNQERCPPRAAAFEAGRKHNLTAGQPISLSAVLRHYPWHGRSPVPTIDRSASQETLYPRVLTSP